MRDQENVRKGRKEGEEMMLTLIEKLIEDKRFDDISEIKENEEESQMSKIFCFTSSAIVPLSSCL